MAGKRSKKVSPLLEVLESIVDLGLKLGALAFLLVLAYLIYGFFAKPGFSGLSTLPKADQLRLIGVAAVAGKILWVAGAVFTLSAALRFYVEETLGYIISLLGVLLYLGTPYVFHSGVSQHMLANNQAIANIVAGFRYLGATIFVPGAVLILRDLVLRLARASMRRRIKQQHDSSFIVGDIPEVEEVYRASPYSRCWQTPYCRAFVRYSCPAYEGRKSCWRGKRGCMCDGDIIMKALSVRSGDGRSFHRELQYRIGQVPGKTTHLTGGQKRQRCRQCIIYSFHQGQKYKLISPLVFPLVILGMWYAYPTVDKLVREVIAFTDKFMKTVSFLPQAPSGTEQYNAPGLVVGVLVVWLTIMAISYLLRFVEFCIFKLQI